MIQVVKESCVGCGACVRVCPTALLRLKEEKAKAVHKYCLNCGHCQGVCPTDALILNGMDVTPEKTKEIVSFPEVQHLIESNRSIRFYQDQKVEREEIERVLRVLDYSASAKNDQLVQWIVLSGKEKVEEFSDLCIKNLPEDHEVLGTIRRIRNPITCSAPHILIAYANNQAVKGHDDCVIKTTLATMLFHSKGIGSCFLGYLVGFVREYPELKEYLGLKQDETVHSALSFGYNDKEVYKKIPVRGKAPLRYME